MQQNISRRTLLAGIGSTTTVALAGCIGSSEPDPSNSQPTSEETDAPRQQTPTSDFFTRIELSEDGGVLEVDVDDGNVDEDIFEVQLVSANDELIHTNPLAGQENSFTYPLGRSGAATNGRNYLRARDVDENLILEQEVTLTYGLEVTDVSVNGDQLVTEDGDKERWTFTFENTGNASVQLTNVFITEKHADQSPIIWPQDSGERDRLFSGESLEYFIPVNSLFAAEDDQPIRDAIDSDDPVDIPFRVSLNNDIEIYEFVVSADVSGDVLEDPPENENYNTLYYPSDVALDVSAQPELVN